MIAGFATTLTLPVGRDGAAVEVPLRELDDLHPDELYENVALFEELAALRQRVARGEAAALAELQGWAEAHGRPMPASRARARGSAVPADRRLSDFQSLIGDMQGTARPASPASELIARIVGPHVQAAPSPAQDSQIAAIDAALSDAMRTILHHPDFQSVEATWRALEFLARRIETGPAPRDRALRCLGRGMGRPISRRRKTLPRAACSGCLAKSPGSTPSRGRSRRCSGSTRSRRPRPTRRCSPAWARSPRG